MLLSVYAGVAQQKAMQGGGAAGKCSFIAQVTAQQVGTASRFGSGWDGPSAAVST